MRVVPDWQEMTKVLRYTVTSAFIMFFLGFIFLACDDDFHLGKSKEELYREMFRVDSLVQLIQLELGDSSGMDFEEFYINAQRINNGHN